MDAARFSSGPAYPPFAKLLQSFPILFLRSSYTPPLADWSRADEFGLGRDFLYHSGAPWRPMLLSARIITIACTATLAFLVFWWTRRRYGEAAALMALALLALDPRLLAHGHLATSDIPVTLFLFAAWIAWDAWLSQSRTSLLLAAGTLAAIAIATKYSALILVAIFPAAWLLARPRPRIPLRSGLICLLFAPAFVILAIYGFDTRSPARDPILAGRVHGWYANIPIPAYYFFRGFQLLYRFGHGGHITYFLGEIRFHATPLYFPVAFLVKMPLATLIVCAWAAALVLSRGAPTKRQLASLIVAAGLIFAMGIASPLDIGFRHVMPMFPFLFISCAAVFTASAARFRAIAAAALIAPLAIESLSYTPDFVPFFNFAAGGARNGHRFLLDSNVDWGQDLIRLEDWAERNHPRRLCLSYFGTADPRAYGLDPVLIDHDAAVAGCDVAAISQEIMYGAPGDRFRLLRMRQPDAMAGMLSIYRLP